MSVQEDLQLLMFKYGVIGNTISVILALVLTNLIASFIGDFIVPCIHHFFVHLRLKHVRKYLPGKDKFNLLQLTKTLITFLFTMALLYAGFVYMIHPFMKKEAPSPYK